ncbi:hypothetical protein GCM10027614_17480 [Micromonospora vulcania]
MVKAPPAAAATGGERDDLEPNVGRLGRFDERGQLATHHVDATDRAAQHRLVHHGPELGRVLATEQLLALHPQPDPAVDLGGAGRAVAQQDDCPGVLPGLQEAGDELHLVAADQRGGRLQAQVRLEPGGQHVAVTVPPAGAVGVPGELE